jgi:hypothetical protein
MKKCYIIIALLIAGLYSMAATTLYTPVLVAPADNAIKQMPNALLNWNPVSGNIGISYEIQIDTSVTFSNPIVLETEFSSINPSELRFDTKYYWRVRAKDNTGNSEWSSPRSFTVLVTVTLLSPSDNAVKVMPDAEIVWLALTGVKYFDYQLDTVSTFDSPLLKTATVAGNLSRTKLSNLYFNTKYYRRMRARNDNDTTVWSASRAFTTIANVTLLAPDTSLQDVLVPFNWEKITGINKYVVTYADNPEFIMASTIETTKNLINSDTLNFGVKYYWKVEAVHSVDIASSDVHFFTTRNTVELLSPANNETGVDLTPTFTWTPVKGCVRYDMWLCSRPDFIDSDLKSFKVVNSNPKNPPEKFQLPAYMIDSAIVYYWKVRSLVPGDTSNWSETFSFKVSTAGIQPVLSAKSSMSVFPNPANNKISIMIRSNERATLKMSISNLLGNALISGETQFVNGRSVNEIDVASLPNGVYFVKIQKESSVFMSKLIIDR